MSELPSGASTSGPSVLALYGDLSGPTLWRVLQPFKALETDGYRCRWEPKDAPGIGERALYFDGYVLPRMSWPLDGRHLAEGWFAAIRRGGKFAIYDADDDLFSEHLTHRAFDMQWTDGKTRAQMDAERFERIWTLQQCDGVTVSTQRLATIVRRLTDRPVVVVPNAIDVAWFRRVVRAAPRQISGLTIGWAGGKRPDRDVGPMAIAWGRIAERYEHVTFIVAGHVPRIVTEHVPERRLVTLPWLPLDRYPEVYREIDIACCSVHDEPFNRAKSVIKAYEAAIGNAVVVATPTLYGALIEHDRNGLLAETVDEWETALSTLVESHARRRILARRLTRHVERHRSLAANLWRWPAAWAEIAAQAARPRLATV